MQFTKSIIDGVDPATLPLITHRKHIKTDILKCITIRDAVLVRNSCDRTHSTD